MTAGEARLPQNKKILWNDVDLNTSKGIEGFVLDTDVLQHYLIELAFGKKLASFVRGLNN